MNLFHKPDGVAWIVVFLGNPGPRYAGTRHNAGFMTAEHCEKDTGAKIIKSRFHALTDQIRLEGISLLLMKPQTYMNNSGDAVIEAVRYYDAPVERVIVVSDDITLPLGRLRVRRSGSAGGHNGLKSIIARLESDGFPRVKIGVGSPEHPEDELMDWVTGVFRNQDAEEIAKATARAWEAVKVYIFSGPEQAMNQFNGN